MCDITVTWFPPNHDLQDKAVMRGVFAISGAQFGLLRKKGGACEGIASHQTVHLK